ncbi:hypothetical protein P43SY_011168 [Pythium insidiosum]|uniref:Uncharacterized protein n=1 Tax=Pythium insidiosum TaxID=114742 RepID=A0AAD5L5Q7_PYTIN|nr:hypothetical protein P43SY_011168 [Pythium insidiosum]
MRVRQLVRVELREHDAEREHVGALVVALAAQHLGRHPERRAHGRGHRVVGALAGHAKVGELGLQVLRQQHVPGLEVAVQHHGLQRVQVRERVRHVQRDLRLGAVESRGSSLAAALLVEPRAQVAAGHELGHDAQIGERFPGDADEVHDARVVELRHALGFPEEPDDVVGQRAVLGQQPLDGDVCALVGAAEDLAEAAGADALALEDLV